MTQPTPSSDTPEDHPSHVPPPSSPAPTGPAYPGPPPPGYSYPSYADPPPGYPPYADPPPGYAYLAYADPLAKSRQTAGLLGIFLGGVGVHRFYLGFTSIGVLQILVTIATCGIGGFWGITEGILILSGNGIKTDADGRPLRP